MPELPEVETMVRGIRAAVEGTTLIEVSGCPCERRPITLSPTLPEMRRRTRGVAISGVRRRAKRVVLQLVSGDAFVIEPRMTGLMLLADPPTLAHLRIEWRLRSPAGEPRSLWFWDQRGLGTVRLLNAAELAELETGARLGRDALAMSPEDWGAVCGSTRRAIKVALLDQTLTAGIGNLYASEILHQAAIHPELPANRLTRAQIARLHAATQEILSLAIEYEGSTLGDGTYRNALNQNGGYQNAHRVYDRADELCVRCGRGRIRRIVQAQRSTYFCPMCQRLGRVAGGDGKNCPPAEHRA